MTRFAVEVSTPRDYIEVEISKLKNNVSNIYYNQPISISYQALYATVENLCTLNQDDEIFNDLTTQITEFLHLKVLDLICYEQAHFLHKLKDLWLMYCHKCKIIKNIYLYLESYITRKDKKKIFLWQICMDKFRDIILTNAIVKEKISYLLNLIDCERNGIKVDTKLIHDVIIILDALDMYTTYFENDFLVKSQEYYTKKRDSLLDNDIVEYFHYVQLKITEEEARVNSYLKVETESKIITIIYSILVEEKLDVLMLKLEQADIFSKSDLNDIIIIYDLLVIIPNANTDLCKIFSNYMMKKGSAYVSDTINEGNIIGNLLKFKDHINEIILVCFKNNPIYAETVRTCFKKFVNERKYKPAQFLAKFIDSKMRDKLIPEVLLDKIMVLFRYIQGKDVFEAFYKRYLSKRLLLGKSSSQDAEKYMISKLKVECGEAFTSKLEGMFRDIDLSDNLNTSFKQKIYNDNLPIEFTAHILTSSFWPTFPKYQVSLADQLLRYQTMFQDFYQGKYSGRSLQWNCGLGSCLVKAFLKTGNKEFQVSLFQAIVLLLFNDHKWLTYKNIKAYLNLDDVELKRTLISLVCGKVRILVKVPSGIEIGDEDEFAVNENFTNKLFRIKINQLQYKETEEEQKIAEDEVLNDRHLQIDAALVRLMKQNQRLRHNELITKIFEVLKFPFNPNDIKKRIEILIERDFLARDVDDPYAYYYVA